MRRFPEGVLAVGMETCEIMKAVLMFGGLRPPGSTRRGRAALSFALNLSRARSTLAAVTE